MSNTRHINDEFSVSCRRRAFYGVGHWSLIISQPTSSMTSALVVLRCSIHSGRVGDPHDLRPSLPVISWPTDELCGIDYSEISSFKSLLLGVLCPWLINLPKQCEDSIRNMGFEGRTMCIALRTAQARHKNRYGTMYQCGTAWKLKQFGFGDTAGPPRGFVEWRMKPDRTVDKLWMVHPKMQKLVWWNTGWKREEVTDGGKSYYLLRSEEDPGRSETSRRSTSPRT